MDERILTDNGIDVEKSIQILGDKETYDEFLDKFLIELDTRMPNIQKFKKALDLPNYVILVHAMKSDSKYLGFTKLVELSLLHETAGKNLDISYINEHFDEFINETYRITTVIKQYLGKEI